MNEALADQLIHPTAPPPVPWWPLAPGWWAVIVLSLLLCVLLPALFRLLRSKRERRTQAQQALSRIDPALGDREWLAAHNTLIKRLLKARGMEEATRLYGEPWLDFLCRTCPRLERAALQPLAGELYRPSAHLTQSQRRALVLELQRWMRQQHV